MKMYRVVLEPECEPRIIAPPEKKSILLKLLNIIGDCGQLQPVREIECSVGVDINGRTIIISMQPFIVIACCSNGEYVVEANEIDVPDEAKKYLNIFDEGDIPDDMTA